MPNLAETCLEVNSTKVLEPQRQTPETRDERREAGDERPVESLTCHRCGKVSIAAPEGATSKTRYVCSHCAPIAPEDIHYDQYQFDDSGTGHRLSPEMVRLQLASQMTRIIQFSPPPVIAARDRGEAWAQVANRHLLAKLSEKQRHALILTAWCSITNAEAARISGCSLRAMELRVASAKKNILKLAKRA